MSETRAERERRIEQGLDLEELKGHLRESDYYLLCATEWEAKGDTQRAENALQMALESERFAQTLVDTY